MKSPDFRFLNKNLSFFPSDRTLRITGELNKNVFGTLICLCIHPCITYLLSIKYVADMASSTENLCKREKSLFSGILVTQTNKQVHLMKSILQW